MVVRCRPRIAAARALAVPVLRCITALRLCCTAPRRRGDGGSPGYKHQSPARPWRLFRRSLAFERTPADIAATKTVRPVDTVDSRIGAGFRFGHRAPERTHVKHPPAGGKRAAVLRRGAGMKDFHALVRARLLQSLDE